MSVEDGVRSLRQGNAVGEKRELIIQGFKEAPFPPQIRTELYQLGTLPILHIETGHGVFRDRLHLQKPIDKAMISAVIKGRDIPFILPLFRGVSLEKLETILRTGIDVSPTDSVIWATSDVEKSFEYGGTEQAVMILDPQGMKRSYIEIKASASAQAFADVEACYGQNRIASKDGSKYWYSKLPVGSPKFASPYEESYGWFVPGNAMDTLLGVIVCTTPGGSLPQIHV